MEQAYPAHLAIIPDGNRTRATNQGMPQQYGHQQAYKLTLKLIDFVFSQTPIKALTFRALSTENLKQRSKEELDYLYDFALQLKKDIKKIMETQQINFKRAGNALGLPEKVVNEFRELEQLFHFPSAKTLVIAVNYGGRDEIIRGIKQRATSDGNIETLTEASFGTYLDFWNLPPVDLVIRTKGELASRLSWFMLWWVGYAELFFSSLHFPDFTIPQLTEALAWFHTRATTRNYGK